MILYTPMDLNDVLRGMDKERTFREIEYEGVLLQVEQISLTEARIERVLSTDSHDFLEQKFQPGNLINFNTNA